MKHLLYLLCLLAFVPTASLAGELRVGAAAIDITPPTGSPLAGYYEPRGSTLVLDPLYSKTLVIEQDGIEVALVVCDLISLPRRTVVEARKLIAKEAGIPGDHVMISATHTHTGPVLVRDSARDGLDGGNSDLGRRYSENLPSRIAASVREAKKKLSPAILSAAVGKEEHLSFNRRFVMRDQTVSWNPRKQHPDIVRPAGPIDPDVSVLYFETPKRQPLATYVNFAMHPDTVGGQGISADYPGVLSRLLAECKDSNMLTVFANGCCGNLNHRDIQWLDAQHGQQEARRIGTVLAGAVCRTYPRLQLISAGPLKARSTLVSLPLPAITPEEVSKAKAVVHRLREPKTTFMEKVKAFQVLDVEAQQGKTLEVEVQVITLGNRVAWVSLPGEIFVELGLAIKKASPYPYTMIAELANGSIGYIPDKTAYPQGNYEVVSARCAEGSGEMLVDAALKLLRR